MEVLDFGEEQKNIKGMKARAEILGKISSYTRKIGQVNQAGDAEVSYSDYWFDLMTLMDENIAVEDNIITELRLYHEVVYQICTNYDKFRESGLSREEMETALSRIKEKVTSMNTSGSSELAKELRTSVRSGIQAAEKQIAAIFASNVVESFEKKAGEGG